MSEEKTNPTIVVENGSKAIEPAVTPQDSTQVQVDNKEEANDAVPTVEELLNESIE